MRPRSDIKKFETSCFKLIVETQKNKTLASWIFEHEADIFWPYLYPLFLFQRINETVDSTLVALSLMI